MAAAEIDRSRWGPYLDSLTESLTGKQAEIEVVSLDLGDQIEAEWTPLIGVTYDRRCRHRARRASDLPPLPDQDQARNAANAVPLGNRGFRFGVELAEPHSRL